jgi:hypothetical protein
MKRELTVLIASVFTCAVSSAALVQINSTGVDSSVWIAGQDSFRSVTFEITENPSDAFSTTSFSIFYFVDDRELQTARPYGALSSSDLTTSFYRAGDTVDLPTASFGSAEFLRLNELQNNAENGADNFVGLRVLGPDSQYRYGWLQFELNQFTAGGVTAVAFIGGVIESRPNTSFNATSVVPEPSTALLGGLGMLALLRRRRGV